MRTWVSNIAEDRAGDYTTFTPARPRALRPSYLHVVTAHELHELRQVLARGMLPVDFEAKLIGLAQGDLLQRSVARNCRTFVALLSAVQEGSFREASPEDCDRLLRVLAYVRKEYDAIPDYKPNGFADDQEEVRILAGELGPLLKSFKAWRLRYQVPAMWWS
jgi:hypothetical protein